MAIPTRITDFSTTAASNFPSGSEAVGTSLDDYLRAYQAVVGLDLASKGADIASAATTDLGAVGGLSHDITGTATITSFGTVRAGILKILKFEGALTLTHNSTSLILPGAVNVTTADGDIGVFVSEGSGNWRCVSYFPAAVGVYGGPVLGTEQASTSGTTIDFTSIPAWVKRVTINFVGVSTNGTSDILIQIGDSGGVETSGYLGAGSYVTTAGANVNSTTGFIIPVTSAAAVFHGQVVLSLEDASDNTWTASGLLALSNTGDIAVCAGSKATSAALDRVRITTVNGTDAFDAGSINIQYE